MPNIFANASDMVLYRPNNDGLGNGNWWTTTQASGFTDSHARTIGAAGDIPVRYSDFDGDGSADMALWRPSNGTWYILTSGSNFNVSNPVTVQWGTAGDVPLENVDFDGDGKTDLVVYRPNSDGLGHSAFWILQSSDGTPTSRIFGQQGDIPVQNSDFDGDGRTDLALWRPSTGTWYVLTSGSNYTNMIAQQWGTAGDIPLSNIDYDNDGKADWAVFRPNSDFLGHGAFLIKQSSDGAPATAVFGQVGDVPIQNSDYDGDGRTDLSLWRPSTNEWLVLMSGGGPIQTRTVGLPGDVPIPNSDFDGDGMADMTLWRDTGFYSYWVVYTSSSGFTNSFTVQWGTTGDIPVPMNFSPPGCCGPQPGRHPQPHARDTGVNPAAVAGADVGLGQSLAFTLVGAAMPGHLPVIERDTAPPANIVPAPDFSYRVDGLVSLAGTDMSPTPGEDSLWTGGAALEPSWTGAAFPDLLIDLVAPRFQTGERISNPVG